MSDETRAVLDYLLEKREGVEYARYMTERWYIPVEYGAAVPGGHLSGLLRVELGRRLSLSDEQVEQVDWHHVVDECRRRYRPGEPM